jgi:hypothetical protein
VGGVSRKAQNEFFRRALHRRLLLKSSGTIPQIVSALQLHQNEGSNPTWSNILRTVEKSKVEGDRPD